MCTVTYHSEHGQDKWLNENIFHNQTGGVFVEVGALDGMQDSNSLFFEAELGWTGLCVEPNPDSYARLVNNRKCACVNCAVGSSEKIMEFRKFAKGFYGWSGLTEHLEPEQCLQIKRMVPTALQEKIHVNVSTLNVILAKHGITEIDYMSVDVEGAEYEVFSVFDFARFRPRVLDVEDNFEKGCTKALILGAGYKFVTRLGVNDIFVSE